MWVLYHVINNVYGYIGLSAHYFYIIVQVIDILLRILKVLLLVVPHSTFISSFKYFFPIYCNEQSSVSQPFLPSRLCNERFLKNLSKLYILVIPRLQTREFFKKKLFVKHELAF